MSSCVKNGYTYIYGYLLLFVKVAQTSVSQTPSNFDGPEKWQYTHTYIISSLIFNGLPLTTGIQALELSLSLYNIQSHNFFLSLLLLIRCILSLSQAF